MGVQGGGAAGLEGDERRSAASPPLSSQTAHLREPLRAGRERKCTLGGPASESCRSTSAKKKKS